MKGFFSGFGGMNHRGWRRRIAPVIWTGLLALGSFSVAQAAVTYIDFNTNPAGSGLYLINSSEPTPWRGTGGVGDSGYLAITDARGSTRTHILFKDFEPGFVMAAMKFSCDLRIGGGTTHPADGFSLNLISAQDPTVAAMEGGDNGDGTTSGTPTYAGTDAESDLPEEGGTCDSDSGGRG